MCIKILIADDHAIVRGGLKALISQQPNMEIIGEAEDGNKAVRLCRKLNPDIVIMDISMPEKNGIEATREIIEENNKIKILALSMHTQKEYIQNILEAGAAGYLLKNCVNEEITDAINTVLNNQVYICSKLSNVVMNALVNSIQTKQSATSVKLSPRERQVIQLLAEGKRTKEIASTLFISPRTVEVYRAQIMKKLEIDSVAELTKYAIREGITSLDY